LALMAGVCVHVNDVLTGFTFGDGE